MSDLPPPPPPPGASAPTPPPLGEQPPNNNLVLAIIVTVLCCLPFGIVAIVKAAEVNNKWQTGDRAGAQASAEAAKKWSFWAIGAGLLAIVLYLVLVFGGILTLGAFSY